jgi:lipoate-protein ligase B
LSIDNRTVRLISLDVTDYGSVWNQQKELQQKLISQQEGQALIVCQHSPVITVGKSAKSSNVLFDKEFLNQKGVQIYDIERGGDVTFHGPGQLVAYPI